MSFEAVCDVADLLDTPVILLGLDGRIRHLNPAYEHQSKLSLVAEGIETPGELETLIGLGVHLVQGYLLGRPKPHR